MLLLSLLLAASHAAAVTIPQPNETYAVHNTVKEVVDYSRTYSGYPWRIITTVFYPVGKTANCVPYLEPYMPTLTANYTAQIYSAELGVSLPNSSFNTLELENCNSSRSTGNTWPLTLFSSGAGATRQLYSALAEELASRGYIVVTMDDPGQAAIIQFPDVPYIFVPEDSPLNASALIDSNLVNRTADILFVKQQALAGKLLPQGVNFDKSRVAVWGHSFGGAGSAQAMAEDSTLKGGVNLDGSMYGSVVQTGLERPFLIWGRTGDNSSSVPDWGQFLNHSSTNNKLVLELEDSAHLTFSDAPLIADLTGLSAYPGIDVALGGLDGRRVLVILATYVDAFFRFSFGEGLSTILRGPSSSFPEVEFTSKPLA